MPDETYMHRGPFTSHYDRTKHEAHRVALGFAADGLDVRIVQPGIVYGPGDTAQTGELVAQVARGRRPQVPAGGGGCWAHVDDIAEGHLLAMDNGGAGASYMLAGPRSTLADALRTVARIAGTKGPMVLPDGLVRSLAGVLGVVGRVVPLPPWYAAETLNAGLATYYGSPAKAERDLGWRARDLETGLRQTVQALR
ncbi:MAG: NAD-dependent epimerase/dehydratase family protein [Nocardioidaceae bacterium]|nr:NAD-dependent epimerase/dehydratase family protein [Nocardioidaceae bacterium]